MHPKSTKILGRDVPHTTLAVSLAAIVIIIIVMIVVAYKSGQKAAASGAEQFCAEPSPGAEQEARAHAKMQGRGAATYREYVNTLNGEVDHVILGSPCAAAGRVAAATAKNLQTTQSGGGVMIHDGTQTMDELAARNVVRNAAAYSSANRQRENLRSGPYATAHKLRLDSVSEGFEG